MHEQSFEECLAQSEQSTVLAAISLPSSSSSETQKGRRQHRGETAGEILIEHMTL